MELDIMMMRDEFYGNVDPRRRQERKDARMIAEDKKAVANLNPKPIYHTFDAFEDVERLAMYDQSKKRGM